VCQRLDRGRGRLGTGNGGNFVYGDLANGEDSFIGAGNFNATAGESSFVGAGGSGYLNGGALPYCCSDGDSPPLGNIAGAADSFVGTGDLNQIASTGNGSFIGAGGFAYASTKSGGAYPTGAGNTIAAVDSFIGAGDSTPLHRLRRMR